MKEQFLKYSLLLGLIAGLIIIFISTILGQIYFNTTFWIFTGVGLLIISGWVLRYFSNQEIKGLKKDWDKQILKLTKDGIKITVDLNNCEIKSSTERIEKGELNTLDESHAIDIILNSGENGQQEDINFSTLVYNHKTDKGQIIKFYGPTTKDKKTLEILCSIQKHTTIHYDKNDPEDYYFDLKFLS